MGQILRGFSVKYAPAFSVYRSGELKHSGHQYRDAPLGENIAGKTSTNMAAEYTGNNSHIRATVHGLGEIQSLGKTLKIGYWGYM